MKPAPVNASSLLRHLVLSDHAASWVRSILGLALALVILFGPTAAALAQDIYSISSVSASPESFSPDGDGEYDTTSISFTTSHTAAVDLKITDSDGVLMRTLLFSETLTAGQHFVTWNGRNDSAVLLPDGTYTYTITGVDDFSRTDQKTGALLIDRRKPLVVDSPTQGQALTGEVNFIAHPTSPDFTITQIYIYLQDTALNSPNSQPINVSYAQPNGQGEIQTSFDTHWLLNSSYILKTYTNYTDSRGMPKSSWQAFGSFTVDNGLEIRYLHDEPDSFSPDGDGRYDTNTLQFTLAGAGNVTIHVTNQDGTVVRTLADGMPMPRGQNQITWDAKTDSGQVAPDGLYAYRINESDGVSHAVQQTSEVMVDTREPLTLTAPVGGSRLSGTVHLSAMQPADLTVTSLYFYWACPNGFTAIGYPWQDVDGTWQMDWDTTSYSNATCQLGANLYYYDGRGGAYKSSSLAFGDFTLENAISLRYVDNSPHSFSPNNDGRSDTNTLNLFISNEATLTVQVKDAGGSSVRTLVDAQPTQAGNQTFVWDGKNDHGDFVADGSYTYQILSVDGGGYEASASSLVLVDTRVPVRLISPQSGAALTGTQQFILVFNDGFSPITSYSSPYLSLHCPGSWYYVSLLEQPDGTWTGDWNSTNSLNGTCSIVTTLYYLDALGEFKGPEYPEFGQVLINNPLEIRWLNDTIDSFSPDGDGRYDYTTIEYELNEAGMVTLKIYGPTGNLVRTLLDSETALSGRSSVNWDGHNDAGQVVPDGLYSYQMDAMDSQGQVVSQQVGDVLVDTRVPLMLISPPAGTALSGQVRLEFQSTVGNNLIYSSPPTSNTYVFWSCAEGSSSLIGYLVNQHDSTWAVDWDTTTVQNNTCNLFTWGGYSDSRGGYKQAQVQPGLFTVANRVEIRDISDAPDSFNPLSSASQYQSTSIQFSLSQDASVSLRLYAPGGALVRVLTDQAAMLKGTHSIGWDGKDGNDLYVPDGIYTYKIDAVDSKGLAAFQRSGSVMVDSRAPLTLISPAPGSIVTGTVQFTASQPDEYQIYNSYPYQPGFQLACSDNIYASGAAEFQADGRWVASWDSTNAANGTCEVYSYVSYTDGRGGWKQSIQSYLGSVTILNGVPASLTGSVLDQAGQAIAGATVTAQPVTCTACQPFRTTSSADGTYNLTVVPGDYRLWAEKPAYLREYYPETDVDAGAQVVTADSAAPAGPFGFSLTRLGSIAGTVRDSKGQPLSGVKVEATNGSNWRTYMSATNAQGQYAIHGLPAGDYRVRASRTEFISQYYLPPDGTTSTDMAAWVLANLDNTTSGVDFNLARPGMLQGTVRNSAGDPISGARISFLTPGCTEISGVNANNLGQYTYITTDAAQVKVRAEQSGYVTRYYKQGGMVETCAEAEVISVGETGLLDGIDVQLPRLGVISGQVTTLSGSPLEGAAVYFSGPSCQGCYAGTTTPSGSFRFENLLPGAYQIWAMKDNYVTRYWSMNGGAEDPAEAGTITVALDTTVGNIVFPLRRSGVGSIQGKAVDHASSPLNGVTITAAFGGQIKNTTSAANGAFTFANLTEGSWQVSGSPLAGYASAEPQTASVQPGEVTTIQLTYTKLATLTGKVHDQTGQPLPGVTISAASTGSGGTQASTTNDQGSYALQLLPGNWTVSVSAVSGYATPAAQLVTLAAGQSAALDFTFTASPALSAALVPQISSLKQGSSASVSFNLTNSGRASASAITVALPAGLDWLSVSPDTINELKPGQSVSITFTAHPSLETIPGSYHDALEISTANHDPLSAEFAITVLPAATGSISVTVRDSNGAPIPNASVSLLAQQISVYYDHGMPSYTYEALPLSQTGEDGVVIVPDVPVGSYAYSVIADNSLDDTGMVTLPAANTTSNIQAMLEPAPFDISFTVEQIPFQQNFTITTTIDFTAFLDQPVLIPQPLDLYLRHPESPAEQLVPGNFRITNPSRLPVENVKVFFWSEFSGVRMEVNGEPAYQPVSLGDIPPMSSIDVSYVANLWNNGTPGYAGQLEIYGTYPGVDEQNNPIDIPIDTAYLGVYVAGKDTPGSTSSSTYDSGRITYYTCSCYSIPRAPTFPPKKVGVPVKIEISQNGAIESEAFKGTLKINNTLGATLQNFATTIQAFDSQGNDVSEDFHITGGSGPVSIPSGQSYTGTWTIVPGENLGGAKDGPGLDYTLRAHLTYEVNGQAASYDSAPSTIHVSPQPELYIDYYLPRFVTANEPFDLMAVIRNQGGVARNFTVSTGAPTIVDNVTHAVINFQVIGAGIAGGEELDATSLTVNFKDIPAMSSKTVYWRMVVDVDGEFTKFDATFTTGNSLGLPIPSPLKGVTTTIVFGQPIFTTCDNNHTEASYLVDADQDGKVDQLVNMVTHAQKTIAVPDVLSYERDLTNPLSPRTTVALSPVTTDLVFFKVPIPEDQGSISNVETTEGVNACAHWDDLEDNLILGVPSTAYYIHEDKRISISGKVTDGHGNALIGVFAGLYSGDNTSYTQTTYTDAQGRYEFVFPDRADSYRVRVTLRDAANKERIHWGVKGLLATLETPPFGSRSSNSMTQNINFGDTKLISAPIPSDQMSDLALTYFHTHQVYDFVHNQLKASELTPVDHLESYMPLGYETAYYSPVRNIITFSDTMSGYANGNRPMNREWHENFHQLMDAMGGLKGMPDYASPNDKNHGGIKNSTTTDSLIEGWAEFWPLVLADTLGSKDPEIYLTSFGRFNMEYDWASWSALYLNTMSVEEFGAASLLWDFYDGTKEYSDHIDLSLSDLWAFFKNRPGIKDIHDLYLKLSEAAQSRELENADGSPISQADIDSIFTSHGFFEDRNGNQKRDDSSERVGYGGRADRNSPLLLPSAGIQVNVVDSQGQPLAETRLYVNVHFADPYYDFSYEINLEQAQGNIIRLGLPMDDSSAWAELVVRSETGQSQVISIENHSYWQWANPDNADYARTVTTVVQPDPALDNLAPSVHTGGPYTVLPGQQVMLTASGSDPDGDALTYTWDLDGNGSFETSGSTVIFNASGCQPGTYPVAVRVSDSAGHSAIALTDVVVPHVDYSFYLPILIE